jgi:hypothetical protein
MSGFIYPDFAATRERELSEHAPTPVLDFVAMNAVFIHGGDEILDVVTQEVQLVDVIFIGRMNCDFGGRQAENEPTVANIDVLQFQYIPQKGAVRFWIRAVND